MKALVKDDGTRCISDDEMRVLARGFYENLFLSEGSEEAELLLQHIDVAVSNEMNT